MKGKRFARLGMAAGLSICALGAAQAEDGAPVPVAPAAAQAAKPRLGWLSLLGLGGSAAAKGPSACGELPALEPEGEERTTERIKDPDGGRWLVTEAHVRGLAGARAFLCADGRWIRFGRGERVLAVRRQAERRAIEVLTRNEHCGGAIDYWMIPERAELPDQPVLDPADLDPGWARLDLASAASDPNAAWAATVLSRAPAGGRR